MIMRDTTGEPRSDEDLQEAINCINEIMIKHSTVLPLLTVHAGIIKDCLLELRAYRTLIKKLKTHAKEAPNG